MPKSYQRLVITPNQKQDQKISLTSEQYHYLSRVLRLKNSDRFIAMDGLGAAWIVELQDTEGIILEALIVATELPIHLTLMVALPKGNGFEDIIRPCTELGVTTFIPLISDRTLLKPSGAKIERWRKIVKEAAEQSERQILPTIFEPISFKEALNHQNSSKTSKFICVARGNHPHLLTCLQPQLLQDLVILTGPEGGWTENEVKQAIAANFQPVSLGKSILRAITAAIAVSALVNGKLTLP